MTLTITNDELRSLIPNVIHEVEGEALLADKLLPWIDTATAWLTDNFIGKEFSLQEGHLPLAKKIVVAKAFAEAVPSLDLSLSPAGFSVISTEGRVPASKERVERLIASLSSTVEANLLPFILNLLSSADWRSTEMGQYWLGTFMFGLDDAMIYKRDKDLLSTYRSMRDSALRFEAELAQKYLGKILMQHLRVAKYSMPSSDGPLILFDMIRRTELRYITFHSSDQSSTQSLCSAKNARCPEEHEVWHLVEPILRELQYWPELREIWEAEMGEQFNVEPFKNSHKGAFFF